jgi:hypothetical protein
MKQKETSTQAVMNRFIETDLTTLIVDGVFAIRKKVDTNFLTTYSNAASVSLLLITPAFSPVDIPHSSQLSRFNGLLMLTTQAITPQWISASRVSR